jgi:hypothetical protein
MSLGLGVVDLAPVTTGFLDVMEQVLVVDGLLCGELVVACLFVRHVLPPQITCVDKRPLLEAWYLSIKRKPPKTEVPRGNLFMHFCCQAMH